MFIDSQDLIAGEEAQIERWFGRGPTGPLFFADDGRAFNVTERQVAGWRTESRARLYLHVDDGSDQTLIACVLCVFGMLLGGGLAGFAGASGGGMLAGSVGGLIPGLLLVPYARMLMLRREQADYRREIAESLARSVPLANDSAEGFRLTNPYRTMQHITIGLSVLVVTAVSVVPGLFQDSFGPAWLYLLLPALAVAAWGFYLAADERDRALDKERKRLR